MCPSEEGVNLDVLSVQHLPLRAQRGGAWAHLGDSAAAAAAAATHYGPALHVQSAAVVTLPLMNSGRAEREKKGWIDLIAFQTVGTADLYVLFSAHNVPRIMYGPLPLPKRRPALRFARLTSVETLSVIEDGNVRKSRRIGATNGGHLPGASVY